MTATSLVPEDTDGQNDLYLSSGGTYELLTTGPTGGNGPFGVSPGGGGDPRVDAPSGTDEITQVYFRTNEALVAEDVDTTVDLYVHSAAGTALISTGPTATDGTPNYVLTLVGFSQSGDRIIFETGESLVAEDTDGGEGDVYERSGGTTTLVSTGPLDSPPLQIQFVALGLTPDGSHVFFPSGVALTADDDDSSTDLYVRAAGVTTLVSNAPASSGGALAVGFAGTSDDGSRVFIRTRGVLIPADTDNAFDIYEMTPGGPVLTSTGPNDAPGSSTHIAAGHCVCRRQPLLVRIRRAARPGSERRGRLRALGRHHDAGLHRADGRSDPFQRRLARWRVRRRLASRVLHERAPGRRGSGFLPGPVRALGYDHHPALRPALRAAMGHSPRSWSGQPPMDHGISSPPTSS